MSDRDYENLSKFVSEEEIGKLRSQQFNRNLIIAVIMLVFACILIASICVDSMHRYGNDFEPELIDHCQPEIIETREKFKGE